jgi:hypothetical protein
MTAKSGTIASALSIVGGALAIIDFTAVFIQIISGSQNVILSDLISWYTVGVTFAILVICGVLLAHRKHKVGKYLVFFASLSFPISLLFLLAPTLGSIFLFHYSPFIGSPWLTFSLVGGIILIIRAR